MKNTFKVLGIAAFVAVVGFLFASCDSTGGDGGSKEVIATVNQYDANGKLTIYSEWEYSSDGRNIKQSYYWPNGVLTSYNVPEYDANGRMVKSSNYYPDGVLSSNSVYEYDANGRRVKSSNYSPNGVLIGYSVYIYKSL
jgi:hypothetical protein